MFAYTVCLSHACAMKNGQTDWGLGENSQGPRRNVLDGVPIPYGNGGVGEILPGVLWEGEGIQRGHHQITMVILHYITLHSNF